MAKHTLLGEVWFRQVQLDINAFCSHEERASGEVEKRGVRAPESGQPMFQMPRQRKGSSVAQS